MKLHLKYIAFVFVLLFSLRDRAYCCSCAYGQTICDAYKEASAVFVGIVLNSSPATSERVYSLGKDKEKITYTEKQYRFSVERSFKGIESIEVEVQTGIGGGDCGFQFKEGERYLVYTYFDAKTQKHYTSICTRTKSFSRASEDLDYLLDLPQSASKSRISGSVWQRTNERDSVGYQISRPMSGVKVVITGQGRQYEAVTNEQGVYVAVQLPPGKYKVQAELPGHLSNESQEVDLSAGGCALADIRTASNGRINGRVIDSQGNVVPNAKVDLIPAVTEGKTQAEILDMSDHERTDKEGRFQFREIPPGRFYLGINLREEPRGEFPYPRTYYPGTTDQSKATTLVLEEGGNLSGYDIPLPPALTVITIKGVFLWSDGRPVTVGNIYLNDTESVQRSGRLYSSAEVDGQGRFTLQGFKGIECWLHGSTYATTDLRMEFIESEPIKVLVVEGIESQRLIAPVPKKKPKNGDGEQKKTPQ